MRTERRNLLAGLALLLLVGGGGALAEEPVNDYRFQPGDQLRISVYKSPDLTTEARVAGDGTIGMPLIGAVRVRGLTAVEVERAIASELRAGNFIAKPQVTVTALQVFGNLVSVLGHVNQPGRYPIEGVRLRLSDVLSAAGGVSATGGDVVTVLGTRQGRPVRLEVDLHEIFQGTDPAADPELAGGDTVFVPRAGTFYIYGNVQNPGSYRLERRMTLRQALAAGGGASATGNPQNPVVHRRAADGKIEELSPKLSELIQDGDVIYVRERVF